MILSNVITVKYFMCLEILTNVRKKMMNVTLDKSRKNKMKRTLKGFKVVDTDGKTSIVMDQQEGLYWMAVLIKKGQYRLYPMKKGQ
jgi:hypothetical protein